LIHSGVRNVLTLGWSFREAKPLPNLAREAALRRILLPLLVLDGQILDGRKQLVLFFSLTQFRIALPKGSLNAVTAHTVSPLDVSEDVLLSLVDRLCLSCHDLLGRGAHANLVQATFSPLLPISHRVRLALNFG